MTSVSWSGQPHWAGCSSVKTTTCWRSHTVISAGHPFAGLIYGHQLDLSIGQAVRDLALIAQVYDPDDLRDRVEYLPL